MSIVLIDKFIQSWSRLRTAPDAYIQQSAIAYMDAARKADIIHFPESTMRMLMEKLQNFEQTIQELEEKHPSLSVQEVTNAAKRSLDIFQGAWITFHKPIHMNEKDVGALFCWVPSSRVKTGKDCYYLILVDSNGGVLDGFTCASPGEAWDFDPMMHICPFGECTREYDLLLPCNACKVAIVLWSQIFALSLIIAGQYLATNRYEEREQCIMHHISRQKSNKVKKVPITYTYKVIDANEIITHIPPPSDTATRVKETRDSWVITAEMEGDLEYRQKQTNPFTRHYRHERYINMKGKEQHFPNGISRKQPVRKSLDGKRITKVKASDYEK